MADYTDVQRDENGSVRTVASAFWTSVHQPELLEAVALDNPREADEGVFDYAERLAVEAGLLPISKGLRERNRLRYADRMPKNDEEARAAGRLAEAERTRPRPLPPPVPYTPPVPARQLPHEHDFEVVGDFLRCECGARTPLPPPDAPPVEPGDRIPDYTPVGGDDDDEWI